MRGAGCGVLLKQYERSVITLPFSHLAPRTSHIAPRTSHIARASLYLALRTYFLRFTMSRSEDLPFFRVLRSTLPHGLQGWRPPEAFPSPPPRG